MIERKAKRRFQLLLLLFFCALVLSITFALTLGPVKMSPITVWKIALSHLPFFGDYIDVNWSQAQERIIWDIRLPRVLLGAVVGAGLSVVGVVIQALVRNSLADPYILGISSGSSVAATLVILFGALPIFGQYALSLGAFIGAIVAMVAVYLLAQVGGRIQTTRLLLAGVAISMILSAVTNFIVTLAPKESGIRGAMFWMMGSLAGAKWEYIMIPTVVVLVGTFYLLFHSRSLNVLLMGEEAAATLGVNIDSFRKILIIISSLLTGTVVAVSGSIGFIGLVVPHLVRLLIGTDHKRVLPFSILIGMILVIWSDVCARMLLAPQELPIGVVTALCGGPFFIWLLRRSSYSFGGGSK
ncbi:FecCD family ABC transporter permease [Viridibacillus soli]|uniref:FecCD family ABC transporter permease n=1 Tax=Viridibacillus soli TaxID=2798301 RepID=UPI001F200392|nr:iron ABC transporter permease [Viridibacillus soli]